MDTLIKQPNEVVLYDMDMTGLGHLSSVDTIASVVDVVSDDPGITITNPTHNSASTIQFVVAGGVSGTKYKITAQITTTNGDLLFGEGIIKVVDL